MRRMSRPAAQGKRAMDATEAAAGRIEPTRRETVRALGAAIIGNWFDLFDYFSAQIGLGVGSRFSPTNRLLTTSRPVTCLSVRKAVASRAIGLSVRRFDGNVGVIVDVNGPFRRCDPVRPHLGPEPS